MTSLIPKFNLLYYKHLVDISVYNFLDLFESSFVKDEKTGTYVMSDSLSYSKLKTIFFELVLSELKNIIEKYDPCSPKYFIIINGCIPKDNLLYKLKNSQYFPAKLSKLIESSNIKYFIKEKGIKVNIEMFNDIFADIFNMFFKNIKHLGKEYEKNVFFVQHSQLDCYAIFKIVKYIYGNSNCINLFIEKYKDKQLPLIAVNDLINKYVHEKHKLNKSSEFKSMTQEIKEFLNEKISFKIS